MARIAVVAVTALMALLALSAGSASAASMITVNSTADEPLSANGRSEEKCESEEGHCTLRAAIELADEHSLEATITTPAGQYGQSQELTISDDAEVTIDGAGAGRTIIEGKSDRRVFHVEEATSLRLNGVTVSHGNEDEGAGIYVDEDATLIVESSAIEENEANDEAGGVLAFFNSTVTIKESVIAHNRADFDGGGLTAYAGSDVVIEGSTIEGNSAEEGGGVAGYEAGVTIERSTVDNNTADGEGGGWGGGIYSETGECDGFVEGSLTVRQSTIDKNVAAETDDGEGGGIYVLSGLDVCEDARTAHADGHARPAQELFSEFGLLTVEQSTIADNVAGSEGGGKGGGVFEDARSAGPTAKHDPIVNSTITGNRAGDEGGGVYTEADALAILISDTVADNASESAQTGNNLATGEEDVSEIELRNTIVAEEAGEHEQNCSGNIGPLDEGAGYNLDFPSTTPEESEFDECGLSGKDNDLVDVAPGFEGGLVNHEGPTQTIALGAQSKAIGAVPLVDCVNAEEEALKVDQRGKTRPGIAGKGCDIGAYEYQEPPAKHEEIKSEEKKEESKPAAKTEVLAVKITSPVQCASKRSFTIHIQNVKQLGIVSATVAIDGKHKRKLTGKELKTGINLRGLPRGTFTVQIVAVTSAGKTLHGKRVYHTCHTRLPGHSSLRL